MGELHHILRCASSRTLPLQRTQKNLSHARDVFLCVYTHIYTYLHDICQRSDNTRVGANCNLPFHMGEFVIWAKYNVGELGCGRICNMDEFCNMDELQHGRIVVWVNFNMDEFTMWTNL